jgi:hypothetical protein
MMPGCDALSCRPRAFGGAPVARPASRRGSGGGGGRRAPAAAARRPAAGGARGRAAGRGGGGAKRGKRSRGDFEDEFEEEEEVELSGEERQGRLERNRQCQSGSRNLRNLARKF